MIRGSIKVPIRFEIETSKGICVTDGDFFFSVNLDFFGSEELTEIVYAMKKNVIRLSTQTAKKEDE